MIGLSMGEVDLITDANIYYKQDTLTKWDLALTLIDFNNNLITKVA